MKNTIFIMLFSAIITSLLMTLIPLGLKQVTKAELSDQILTDPEDDTFIVSPEPYSDDIEGKELKGIEIRKYPVNLNGNKIFINAVIIDPSKLVKGIGIVTPDLFSDKENSSHYTGLSLEEYGDLGKFKIIQSGGFLSSWSPPYPLGYVKVRGNEYNRAHDSWVTEGFFCTDGQKFIIGSYTDKTQFETWPSCLQTGPVIALNKNVVLNTERKTGYVTKEAHRQSFLCKNDRGFLVMGIAENPKLIDFANHIILPENAGGLGCIDAVALMSKGISGIFLNYPTGKYAFGSVNVPLPNAIVVK